MKGDREQPVDVLGLWWGDGSELSARMEALADTYEVKIGPELLDGVTVAADLRAVLRREWDPRDGAGGPPR